MWPNRGMLRARVEGLGVVDLAVGVALRVRAVTAELAEPVEARPDRAEGHFLRRELVTGVAVGADRAPRIVGELLAASFLRDLLAVLPVAQQLSVRGIADRREVRLLDPLGDVLRQRLARTRRCTCAASRPGRAGRASPVPAP